MKKGIAVFMALTMLLTLTACGKKAEQTPPAAPAKQEAQVESLPELTEVPELQISAEKVEGRLPGGEYVLPEEVISMQEWYLNGAVGLLAKTDDVAFYGVEGKESNPALLCWGESQAEFDWLYSTPRAIEPELWVYDLDEDDKTEVVVDCYGGSGTGVSMEYVCVVEKNADGTLTGYELPWETLAEMLNEQLQTISVNGGTYAALGRELVDITKSLPDGGKAEDLCLGWIARYTPAENGLNCTFGVTAEGSGIAPLSTYVADLQGFLRYENGIFTLTDLHLLSN